MKFDSLRKDCCWPILLSTMKKCTIVLKILTCGKDVDVVDEYVRMGESTHNEIQGYGQIYIRWGEGV